MLTAIDKRFRVNGIRASSMRRGTRESIRRLLVPVLAWPS